MALAIFPVSPLPADQVRRYGFNVSDIVYDSGARQGNSSYKKPLYQWAIPFRNFNEVKWEKLTSFSKQVFGPRDPFLMKDPYDQYVASVTLVNTTVTNGSTLQTFDTNSYSIRIDTTDITTLTSVLSGFVTLGSEFLYDQDTGVLTVNSKNSVDHWSTPGTISYFRKVYFTNDYSDSSPVWNIFNSNVQIREIV